MQQLAQFDTESDGIVIMKHCAGATTVPCCFVHENLVLLGNSSVPKYFCLTFVPLEMHIASFLYRLQINIFFFGFVCVKSFIFQIWVSLKLLQQQSQITCVGYLILEAEIIQVAGGSSGERKLIIESHSQDVKYWDWDSTINCLTDL